MKKIFNSLVLCFLLSLLMVSCRGLFEAKVENTPDGKCLVTGAVNNPYDAGESRSATSSVDGKDFYYVISGKSSTASETEILYENTNKNFSLEIDKGTWDFYVDVYLVDTGSTSYAAANIIFTGKLLNKIISENSENLTFTLELNTDGDGTLDLPVIVDDSINSCFITRTNLTTPEFHTESFNVTDADGVKKIIISSTPPAGFYSIKMDFYSGPLDEGNVTGSFLYSTTELITLFNGTTITKWDYTDGKLIIDSQRIKKTQNHTIYVDKNSTASTNGTIFSPFSTLKQAVDYVNQVNDATESGTQSAYSIILQTDEAAADEILINGNSHPLDLTIKSAESAFSSISGKDSKQNTIRIATSTSSNLSVTFKDVVVGKSSKTGIAYEKAEGSSLSIDISGYTYINTIKGNVDGVVEVLSDIEKIYVNNMDEIVEKDSADAEKEVSSFSYVPWDTTTTAAVITIPASSVFYDYIDIIETGTDSYELNSQGKLVKIDGSVKQLRKLPAAGSKVFVNDADDLLALASFVNTGEYTRASGRVINLGGANSFSGITVEQKSAITIPSGKNWEPIGYKDTIPFSGTYDGANLKISNFSISSDSSTKFSYNCLGLFGCVKNGTVKNVNLSGGILLDGIKDSDYLFYLGSIVALLSEGTVDNCTSNVNILNSLSNKQNGCGGIVGKTIDSSNVISKCINTNALNSLTQDTYNVGGIVGDVSGATEVYNCINKASVSNQSNDSSSCTSGIAGRISGASVKVFNCYNSGIVIGYKYAAGIVGYCGNFSGTEILNCISEGSISGSTGCNGQIVCFDSSNNGSLVTVNYVYYLDPKGEKSYTNVSRLTDICCKGFSLNNPVDIWYGTLNSPFTILSKYTKALVFFLNGWVKTNNTASKYNTWCVTSGELGFGNAPTDEPEEEYSQYLSSLTFDPSSTTTGKDIVYVKTAADLKALADFVNTGKNEAGFAITDPTFAGITIIQKDDIDLSELKESDGVTQYNWVPVGSYKSGNEKPFSGTYDGNSYEIKNLKLESNTDCSAGLFGYVSKNGSSGGVIKNLTVSGSISTTGYESIGGIVNTMKGTEISNCTADITIQNNFSTYNATYVGGIAAYVNSAGAKIVDCKNLGSVSSVKSKYAGGITGYAQSKVLIYNCINEGSVSISNSVSSGTSAGGIIGDLAGDSSTISNCYNKGKVTVSEGSGAMLGGILGSLSSTTQSCIIQNCVNLGDISCSSTSSNAYSILGNGVLNDNGNKLYYDYYLDGTTGFEDTTNVSKICCATFEINGSQTDGTIKSITHTSSSILPDIDASKKQVYIDGKYYSSLLNSLNKWAETESYGQTQYRYWDYNATEGIHFVDTPPVIVEASGTVKSLMDANQKPESGKTYTLSTAEELFQIATWSDSMNFSNIKFIQVADIDLSTVQESGTQKNWVPIGSTNSSYSFCGCYDGGNYSISNLKGSSGGLFGTISVGNSIPSIIQNIKLKNCNITSNNKSTGGICNTTANTLVVINNCHVSGSVTSTYTVSGSTTNGTGGICGETNTTAGYIINCSNNATVSGNGYVGGICGQSSASFVIVNCYNTGLIVSPTVYGKNGSAGMVCGSSGRAWNCYSYGELRGYEIFSISKNYCFDSYGYKYQSKTDTSTEVKICNTNSDGNGSYQYEQFVEGDAYVPHATAIPFWVAKAGSASSDTSSSISLTQLLNDYVSAIKTVTIGTTSTTIDLLPWHANKTAGSPTFTIEPGEVEGTIITSAPVSYTSVASLDAAPVSGTYSVSSFSELEKISGWVAAGNSLAGVTFVQTKTISFEGQTWTPIGNISTAFAGTYDGNNKEISDLDITATNNFGLFGKIDGAVIQNIIISGQIIIPTTANNCYFGSIAAQSTNSTIKNCINKCAITSNGYKNDIGGIVGCLNTDPSVISDCYNKGSIVVYQTVSVSSNVTNAGGIIGSVGTKTGSKQIIRNCVNIGIIEDKSTVGKMYIGGIVGTANTGNSNCIIIENCGNKGSVSGGEKTQAAGGILGYESSSKADNIIRNCFNNASVSRPLNATYSIGGIVANGGTATSIQNCFWIVMVSGGRESVGWCSSSSEESRAEDYKGYPKVQILRADYSIGDVIIGDDTFRHITPVLNSWINEQADISVYTKWKTVSADGTGEPCLPLE